MTVPVVKVKTLPTEISVYNYPQNFDIDDLMSKIDISPEELTVSSPDDSIDNLETLNIAEIPLTDLGLVQIKGISSVIIRIPDGYGNISGSKVAALAFDGADDYGSVVVDVTRDNFNLINPPAGLSISFLTDRIPVTVVGPSDYITQLTSADITATVSLAGFTDLTVGAKSVSAAFRISGSKVKAWIAGEYKVNINVSK